MAVLHVVCFDIFDNLWHTIRRLDGTWFPFGDVRNVVLDQNPGSFNPSTIRHLDCAGVLNDLHVCLLTNPPYIKVIHTIRRLDGTWFPFGDASAAAQAPRGYVNSVGASQFNGQLSLCAAIEPGSSQVSSIYSPLYHTLRDVQGSWTPFQKVGGSFNDVACAEAGGQLHFCGITFDRQGNHLNVLEHALGPSGGPFTPFGDVRGEVLREHPGSLDPGSFNDVSCAGLAGELHVCATSGGGVVHTIRRANGTWSAFEDVLDKVAAENPGSPHPADVQSVSCAMVNGELHVICIDGDQALFHTIRRADGTWFPFGDVRGVVLAENPGSPVPGRISSVAIADAF